jgi:hypothetical protein
MKQRWIWLNLALWCALSLSAATFVRFSWIEAPELAAHCDAGAPGGGCALRAWIIQAFIHQRLGWAALGLAALAYGMASPRVAGAAVFLACSGLVLYSTELSAPALLLAALVFTKIGQTAIPAKLKSKAP